VSTLAVAIQTKQWELASLCLLMGIVEAAAALPPDAVEGLLEVLAQTGQPVGLAGLEGEDTCPRGGPRPGAGRTGRGRRR